MFEMYERSSLDNGWTNLDDLAIVFQYKVCMKENFWKIYQKRQKFIYYKIEVFFLYVRAYHKKYTDFITVDSNRLAKSWKYLREHII